MAETNQSLQKKIEARAEKRAIGEYKKLVDFMESNMLCKLLKFRKGDKLVPFCAHYNQEPLFETGLTNKMEEADLYTNLNEARTKLVEIFIEEETEMLLKKIDSLSDYFNNEQTNP